MRTAYLKKTLVLTLLAMLSLITFFAFFQHPSTTFAHPLPGSSTPTPLPTPSTTPLPNNGIHAPIIISQKGVGTYELTPYQLSIPSDTQGVLWINSKFGKRLFF